MRRNREHQRLRNRCAKKCRPCGAKFFDVARWSSQRRLAPPSRTRWGRPVSAVCSGESRVLATLPRKWTVLMTTISVDALLAALACASTITAPKALSCAAWALGRVVRAPIDFAPDPRGETRAVSRCGARKSPLPSAQTAARATSPPTESSSPAELRYVLQTNAAGGDAARGVGRRSGPSR